MAGETPNGPSRRPVSPLGTLGAGLDLVVAVLLFLALGWKLDDWLGTAPILMLVGALLGMVVGFYMFYRRVRPRVDVMRGDVSRFVSRAAALALFAGAVVAAFAATREAGLGWAVAGWLAAASLGVVGGARLVRVHGSAGTAFATTLALCILARSVALTGGATLALTREPEGFWPFVVGFAAGYVPLQVFESVWFGRRGRGAPSSARLAAR